MGGVTGGSKFNKKQTENIFCNCAYYNAKGKFVRAGIRYGAKRNAGVG